MPRKYSTKPINQARKNKYKHVFCLHDQPKQGENFRSNSNFKIDEQLIHLEVCVPSKKFYPYALLNTSTKQKKEVTLLISDGTKFSHLNANKKEHVLVIDFKTEEIQNSKINLLKINKGDEIQIRVINDFFDFKLDTKIENQEKKAAFFNPEPKEDGEGVIIEIGLP